MESLSEPQCRAGSPWRGLLITAFILSCWIQSTSAQVTVVPNPPYGEVNHNVTLDIQGFSGRALFYTWYRKAVAETNKIARYTVETGVQEPADIREKVLSNGSLLIPHLTLNDSDDYHVLIVDSQGNIIVAQGHLTVYEPLSKPLINSTNMAPVENKDNVSLTCQSEVQDVTYQWFITRSSPAGDRTVLSPDNKTLAIMKVTREDQGPYKCEIRNPVSFSESEFTLNITYGPDTPIIFSRIPHYPVGATIELNCSAESNPPAQFIWLFDGIQMTSSSKLSIANVSLNHTGTYTCKASNSVTGLSSSKDINITVSERTTKPNLTAHRTNVMENDTLAFTCGTEQKGVDILWFFDDKPLILNERMELSMNNQILTILSLKREDDGSYECEIRNPISSSRSDPITLTVNYGPDYIKVVPNPKKGEIEVKFKGSLTLECRVESYPPAQYIWQVNGTMNSDFSNTYVIKYATWEDSGKYTCLAKNNVTNLSVSKSIRIKVIEQYMGGSNGSSLSGGAITGIMIGVLTGIILIGILIYFQCFRKTTRTNKYQISEKNHSVHKHGEEITMNENTVHLPGSALPAQGPGTSPTFPKDLPESSNQVCAQGEASPPSETKGEVKIVAKDEVLDDGTENRNEVKVETLDITRVDVCDKIDP
ncbi:carcinoembryonic antigen-related cell adhesion molecule 1-like isoform X2 [Antechinus flavipes]|uniref:carcinoembryonic antigen-related cell adhesion molecule 1-like isoform X2 n=1 Tax=Antechinus flavipes TaxID=38775 RepID=UPI0022363378|nr:carcinoembryonic antigen-related cell adhesion molecule 1-like isoform X2 [Antechinus flavipes]